MILEAVIAAAALLARAPRQEPAAPRLSVELRLVDERYRASFPTKPPAEGAPAPLEAFERAGAEQLCLLLGGKYPFLRFEPATGEPQAARLVISIESRRAGTQLDEAWFRMQLVGLGANEPLRELALLFRDTDAYGNSSAPAVLAREVPETFASLLPSDGDRLMSSLFANVPLARRVWLELEGPICALPFTHQSLRAANGSLFRLRSQGGGGLLGGAERVHMARATRAAPSGIEALPRDYWSGIVVQDFAPPGEAASAYAPLGAIRSEGGECSVLGVYMQRHEPLEDPGGTEDFFRGAVTP
jgi:hypothetical protein